MDYWMGRYYGFIEAPQGAGAEATELVPRTLKRRVAAPYTGPARPILQWEK